MFVHRCQKADQQLFWYRKLLGVVVNSCIGKSFSQRRSIKQFRWSCKKCELDEWKMNCKCCEVIWLCTVMDKHRVSNVHDNIWRCVPEHALQVWIMWVVWSSTDTYIRLYSITFTSYCSSMCLCFLWSFIIGSLYCDVSWAHLFHTAVTPPVYNSCSSLYIYWKRT